jgi:F0F1-type ATP synthase assembly protein I
MKIPFAGEVCPPCLRQKKSDQTGTVATGLGLLTGGFIGNLIGGFGWMLIGGFVLGLLASIVSMSGKNYTAKKLRPNPKPHQ